jgi:hypothetical protein
MGLTNVANLSKLEGGDSKGFQRLPSPAYI